MRYRPRRNRYYRRRGGWLGFPFMLLFIIAFASHSWSLFIVGIVLIVILSLIFRAIVSGANNRNAPLPGQQPYQQPYQSYYQPPQPYQEPYQPYEQGYQPPAPTYQEPVQQYQPQPQYEEQPQAQYPQELPPMKQ